MKKNDSKAESVQAEKSVIGASLAGGWYSSDPKSLKREFESYLAAVDIPPVENVIALVSPHAGYRFSGPAAAYGFKQVQGKTYSRVIVMGPSHRIYLRNAVSVPSDSAFSTPLGELPIDQDFVKRLRKYPVFKEVRQALEGENSVELQIPFLQYVLGTFKLVPIVVGQLDLAAAREIGQALRSEVDERTLVVASSDFTHFGPRFQYVPFSSNLAENIEKLDMGAVKEIEAKNLDGFAAYCEKTGATICGRDPIAVLLSMLPPEAGATLLRYDNSGRLSGDYGDCVSYVSLAFTGRWPQVERAAAAPAEREALTADEKKSLLRLARGTIEFYFKKGLPPSSPADLGIELTPGMESVMGAFVTLKEDGELRGCIGEIVPRRALYKAVMEQALNSTLNDSRFMPVEEREVLKLEIEISALTPSHPVGSYNDIEIGKHGMTLSKRGRSAVFLPQVAPEQGWDLATTLTHLSMKAGLPSDAWKEGASFTVFEAIVFREGESR